MQPTGYDYRYGNFINGRFCEPGADFMTSTNPAATHLGISSFAASTEKDVNEAVGAAREAYAGWSSLPMGARADLLEKWAALADARIDELGRLVTESMGKPLAEGKGDILFANLSLRYFAAQARQAQGEVFGSAIAGKKTYTLRRPRGVVGVISPWNFPAMIPIGWQAAPSLIYGNTVVIKPSEDSPELTMEYTKLAEEAGFPRGVINVVLGDGPGAGQPLALHPDVNVVLFTGSSAVGKKLRQLVSDPSYTDKLFFGELGGKNGIIISSRGDYETALKAAWKSSVLTTNQRCVSASKIVVDRKLLPHFAEDLADLLADTSVGYGGKEGVVMGPLINQDALDKYERHLAYGEESWSTTFLPGGILRDTEEQRGGNFVSATLGLAEFDWKRDADPRTASRILTEEAFSPVITLIPYDDGVREAVSILNATDYGLASAIVTNDVNEVGVFESEAPGVKYINGATVAAEIHLPFVGEKGSNIGGIPGNAGIVSAVTHTTPVSVFSLPNPTLAVSESMSERIRKMAEKRS